MVKGQPKAAAGAASSSATQAPRLPQMGTGLNVAGNPVDNIENIQHVGVGSHELAATADEAGLGGIQPLCRYAGNGEPGRSQCCQLNVCFQNQS